jgi:two-component system cell cycle sensor histidine kinase/response regulator CckA
LSASRQRFIAAIGSTPFLGRLASALRQSGFLVGPLPVQTPHWWLQTDAIVLDAPAAATRPLPDWWQTAREQQVPLLVCTGRLGEPELAGWLTAGVTDCFDEQMPLPLVLHRIQQAVEARRQATEGRLQAAFLASLSVSAPLRLAVMESVGAGFVFRFINRTFAADFGRSPEQLVGVPLEKLGLTETQLADVAVWQRWCREALRLGRAVSFVHQSLRSARWFSATFEPLRQPGLVTEAVSIYVEDITDQQAAKLRSVESEERFYRVFQVIPIATAIQTIPDGRYLDVNAAFTRLFGYSRAELIGRTALELGLWVKPEERERYYHELEAHGRVLDFRGSYRTRDGRIGEAVLSAVTLVIGDLPCQLALLQDVTEAQHLNERLRQREEWFHAILNATLDGIIVEDDQRIVYANQAVARLYGVETPEALVGQDFAVMCAPHEEGRLRDYTQRRMRGEVAPATYEFTAQRADGTTVTLENSVSEFFSGGKKYLIAVMRDVEERKRLQATLQQIHKMEAVGRLAGGIAHDFNNLLNSILGFSRLAHRKSSQMNDPTLDEYFRAIEDSAERAAQLVSKLLAFGRQKEASRQTVNLNAVVEDSLFFVRSLLPPNVELVTSLLPDLPPFEGDPDQIQQVIINLCRNACDAMPDGGTLTLGTRADVFPVQRDGRTLSGQLAGHCVCLTVADTGVGMDETTRQHIFDPFFTTKDLGDGAGLGLSVVHGIVTAHGGTVGVRSVPGKGSCFEVRFPALRSGRTGEQPVAENLRRTPGGLPLLPEAARLVLVVEDDNLIAQLFTEILHEVGYDVVVATDGQQGVARFAEQPDAFELVILDALLPKLDGLGCLQSIRQYKPQIPVLVVSGYSEEVTSGELSAQATVFLQKPFTPEVLLSAVARAVGSTKVM